MDGSRRDLIKKAAVAGGLVWASPVLTSLARPAAAAAGTPPPTTTTSTTEPESVCQANCDLGIDVCTIECVGPGCRCAQTPDGFCACVITDSFGGECQQPGDVCDPGFACVSPNPCFGFTEPVCLLVCCDEFPCL
jgi:hypothetical protein